MGNPKGCGLKEEAYHELSAEARAELQARQGVRYPLLEAMRVANNLGDDSAGDGGGLDSVPPDAKTLGEIMLRGNVVMKGYLDDAAATEKAFEGGWFNTGDVACFHENGFVQIKDRAKDLIISGGENISSVEVEGALFKCELVRDAAVVPRSDQKWGEVPVAFVVLTSGQLPEGRKREAKLEAEILAFCRLHLASFMIPRRVEFVKELPKNNTGKLQKMILKKTAAGLAPR